MLNVSTFDNVTASGWAFLPAIPTGLNSTIGNGQVSLTWAASDLATSYNLKRASSSGGSYTLIASNLTTTGFLNTNLVNGTTYYYVGSAVNAAGESGNSDEEAATPNVLPATPTGWSAIPGDSLVTLSWAAASGASSYDIKRSTTSGGPYDLISADPTTPAYSDGSVNNGMIYYFAVSAVNSAGESANSAEVSARPVSSVPPQLNFLLNGNILQFDWLAIADADEFTQYQLGD